ncbi:ATP-grasp peptide maturase system methyltransferase [Kitasatospora sp. NPDC058478]|uniref:ATP-grasp peptide maturase system methyltransferase n=1 Tax=unclassified Kitasatospora TaxID=2633591 RepID=UPI0036563347
MSSPSELRAALADELTDEGVLTDPGWRAAVAAVPREAFVDEYFLPVPESVPTAYAPVLSDDPGFLAAVYSDETLVTQLDGHLRPADAEEPVTGSPSSSSTLPSLVLEMWQQLGVEDGHRVLEVGTGTGYSTALGSHRLGDAQVVSVEVDEGVAARAAASLKSAGFAPTLIVGDGLAGHKDGGPYDRLIATCSVRTLPLPWLYQVRPGGKILATFSGWSFAFGQALLTVTEPGCASGRFLPGYVSFMIARQHDRPPRGSLTLMAGDERPTEVDPATLSDWTGKWVAQLAAPSAEILGAGGQQILMDVATGSHARTTPDPDGGWTVVQRGPLRLWDQVETAIQQWQRHGAPHQDRFGITIDGAGQRVWLGTEDGPTWNLPV